MIRLKYEPIRTQEDLKRQLQQAVALEFSTLPPYLYALYSIPPGKNEAASGRIRAIVLEEMMHMCLACNILNAIGGTPVLADASVVPTYPGPLPGDIGSQTTEEPFLVHLRPFSPGAMAQAMHIEEPVDPIEFPSAKLLGALEGAPEYQTIGQFYAALDAALAELPASSWHADRNQIADSQFFAGGLFAVNSYADAAKAIGRIVSEGEGTSNDPLDFEGHVAHYYRFEELFRDRVLTKADNATGFAWGASLGVDWEAVYPAIADPSEHDFADDPPAQAAQDDCDRAFTQMVLDLQRAFQGDAARLGNGVRAMFELRAAAGKAFRTPLRASDQTAGPAFRYRPELIQGSAS